MADEIADAFGITVATEYPTRTNPVQIIEDAKNDIKERAKKNIDQDYDYVRDNLREMIASTMDMLPNLVELVQQSESASMYQSASAFMKMVADLNKDLISTSNDIGKAVVKKESAPNEPAPESGETNIFIGTGGDVFKRLSKRRRNEVEVDLEELPVINPSK